MLPGVTDMLLIFPSCTPTDTEISYSFHSLSSSSAALTFPAPVYVPSAATWLPVTANALVGNIVAVTDAVSANVRNFCAKIFLFIFSSLRF